MGKGYLESQNLVRRARHLLMKRAIDTHVLAVMKLLKTPISRLRKYCSIWAVEYVRSVNRILQPSAINIWLRWQSILMLHLFQQQPVVNHALLPRHSTIQNQNNA